jgi:hypothetical protein
MNLLDVLIERSARRLKAVNENPDPSKLRSNRLAYELEYNEFCAMRDAWRQGKPFSMGLGANLSRALGFQPIGYPLVVARFLEEAPRYRQVVLNTGMPEHLCDFITLGNAAGYAGDLPPLSFIFVEKGECSVSTYAQRALAEHYGVPMFTIDDPLEYNEENVKYVADQLGELIEFAERKIPGIKYNRDRHLELQEADSIAYTYLHKDWELRKQVPLPMSSRDSFHQPGEFLPSMFADSKKALEYWKVRIEEIEEQAARGMEQEEKLRALWVWVAPLYIDFFSILESRGVVLPVAVSGATGWHSGRRGAIGDTKEFGRKLSPLEEEARMEIGWSWRQLGKDWEDEILYSCRELKCEAIIYYQFNACLLTAPMAKLVADRAEKELGVPTLIIPGRPMNPASISPAEFESRLTEFLDMVLTRKKNKV